MPLFCRVRGRLPPNFFKNIFRRDLKRHVSESLDLNTKWSQSISFIIFREKGSFTHFNIVCSAFPTAFQKTFENSFSLASSNIGKRGEIAVAKLIQEYVHT